SGVAHECAGKHPGFAKDLEAVADANHKSARGGESGDFLHDGREPGDGAGAQIVAVGKAAGNDDGVAIFQVVRLVPEKCGLLSGGGDDGVVAIVIAVGARKDDDAEFHSFILNTSS